MYGFSFAQSKLAFPEYKRFTTFRQQADSLLINI
jgi:hypothetical protein